MLDRVRGSGCKTDDFAIPAGEFRTVGAPAQVRAHDHHLAVVKAALANGLMLLQQHGVVGHDAVNPLALTTGLSAARLSRLRSAAIRRWP